LREREVPKEKKMVVLETKLTEAERAILDDITKDDVYESGLDSCIWADCFLDFTTKIPAKKARGVLSSLIQKNIINPILPKRDENVISFTKYGKEVMRALGY
jgi:hypothetical protein